MMRVQRIALTVLLLMLVLSVEAFPENNQILRVNYYLISDNPQRLISLIREKASESGGYVKFFSGDKVIVRIPGNTALKFREFVAGKGYVMDEQVFRKNVSEKMIELKTRLKVKEKLLKDFYSLFESSRFHQTLDVEKEIGKLVLEIEEIKGKINYYTDRIALSEVTVNINSRRPAVRSGKAVVKWDWIRRLGVPELLNISY
jgi:hypothetical protein